MSDEDKVDTKPYSEVLPSLDAFSDPVVIEAINGVKGERVHSISEMFDAAHKVEFERENIKTSDALRLLAAVTQAMLRPSDVRRPFHPMFEMEGRRGLIPDDFTEDQLALFRNLTDLVEHPILKARIADVVQFRTKRQDYAAKAVEAYLDSVELLCDSCDRNDTYALVEARNLYERVIRLAFYVFKKDRRPERLWQVGLGLASEMLSKGRYRQCLALEKIFAEHRMFSFDERILYLQKEVVPLVRSKDLHLYRDIWLFIARYEAIQEHVDQAREAYIAAAEGMVELAHLSVQGDAKSYMTASAHLSEAIKIYRKVSGAAERKDELRSLLSEYQDGLRDEMQQFSTEIDLKPSIEFTEKNIKGQTLSTALNRLAILFSPSKLDELEAELNEIVSENPLQYMMSSTVSDAEGRTIAVIPSLINPENEEEREKALRYHMERNARFYYEMRGAGFVVPALRIIYEEHEVSRELMTQIAKASLFVPDGHEQMFGKALHAAFHEDFDLALHILVPQTENALREILKQHGEETNTKEKNDDVTQEAITLGAILSNEKTTEIFGPEMVFDLTAVLYENTCIGLRHDISHGLSGDGAFKGAYAAYAFWLIYRLIMLPLIPVLAEEDD